MDKKTSALLEKEFNDLIQKKAPLDKVREAYNKLSSYYIANEDMESFIHLAESYTEYVSKLYGKDSQEAMLVYIMISMAYAAVGEEEKYKEYIEKIADLSEEYGIPSQLYSLLDSFGNKDLLGEDLPDTFKAYEKMEIARIKSGFLSLDYLNGVEDFIKALLDEFEFEQAVEFIERTMDEAITFSNVDSAYMARLYRLASDSYNEIHDYESSADYLKKYINALISVSGRNNPLYEDAAIEYLEILLQAKLYQDSYNWAAKELSEVSSESYYASDLRYTMAFALQYMSKYEQAILLLLENTKINEDFYGPISLESLRAHRFLAKMYISIGQEKLAISILETDKEILISLAGESSDEFIEHINLLVEAYLQMGDGRNAMKGLRILRRYLKEVKELNSPADFYVLRMMGQAYRHMKKYDKAKDLLFDTYDKQLKYYGDPQIEESIEILLELGNVFRYEGDIDKSTSYYEQVLESALKYIGPESKLVKEANQALDQIG